MAVSTYTKSGAKATTTAKLSKVIFGIEVKNHEILKAAYIAYLANGRQGDAKVKTRGEVSGGGRKPWKQKGTGRARFGSSRNPIWTGGGIVSGPTGEENHKHYLTPAIKRLALRQALTLANSENRIKVVEGVDVKSGKTRDVVKLLQKMEANGRVLLAVENKNDDVVRATRNVAGLKVTAAKYLNVFDVINADVIILESATIAVIEQWLGGTK